MATQNSLIYDSSEDESINQKKKNACVRTYSSKCIDKILTKSAFNSLLNDLSHINKLTRDLKNFGFINVKEFGSVLKACDAIITGSFMTNVVLPFKKTKVEYDSDDEHYLSQECKDIRSLCEPNDIDIFVGHGGNYNGTNPNHQKKIELLHRYLFTYGYKLIKSDIINEYFTQEGMEIKAIYPYISSFTGKKIQIIWTVKDPLVEIEKFDLDVCKVYWNGETFGNTHINYNINKINGSITQKRYNKYIERGFIFNKNMTFTFRE